MGLGDFFKNIFGKKICAFCGGECGIMHRAKLKDGNFICSKCDDGCSAYIRKSRFTKPELEEHLAYMKRSDRIYNEVILKSEARPLRLPSASNRQAIEFYDSFGMFRICDPSRDGNDRYLTELFRYDQVASYEPYIEENEPTEDGQPKSFEEGGVIITLIGAESDNSNARDGGYAHPYITEPIKVCFATTENEKDRHMIYVDNVIHHFDGIFGVHDSQKGLFSFGMSKQEKRDLKAQVAMVKTVMTAVKVAKDGEESLTEEKKEEFMQNMNAMDDARTGGLAEYSRRADAAEARVTN